MTLGVNLSTRSPQWTSPTELFQRTVRQGPGPIRDLPAYDVTADGETFLLNVNSGRFDPFTVIVNWPELLRADSNDP